MLLMISTLLPQRIFKTNVYLQNHPRCLPFFDRRRLAFEQSSKVPGGKIGDSKHLIEAIFGEAKMQNVFFSFCFRDLHSGKLT